MAGPILWNLGNLLLLVVVLSRESVVATVLGRYSPAYAAGVIFSLIFACVVAALTLMPSGRRSGRRAVNRVLAQISQYRLGLPIAAAAIIAIFTLILSLPFSVEFIIWLLLFNLVLAAAVLVSSPPADTPDAQRAALTLLPVLLGIVLVVSFFSAHAVPVEQSSGDEPAWTNMAVTWNTTGQAYIKFSGQDVFPIAPGAGWWIAPYGLWLRVFGVSFAAGRMFIWLAYLAAAGCIGYAGARLYDRHTGLTAALLAAVSPLFLSYRIIRPEIGLAAIGALLLVAYSGGKKRPLWAFGAGWLAVFSLEIHAAGLAFIVALLILYGLDALTRLRARRNPFTRQVFALIAGMGVGTIIYLALHVLIQVEPAAYFDYLQSTRGFLGNNRWLEWIGNSFDLLWARSPLEMLLIGVATMALIVRRTPGDRLILRFFAATALSYFLLVPEPYRYLVIFIPFIALGMAALVSYGFRAAVAPPRPAVSLLALAGLCAPFFASSLPGVSLNPMPATEVTPIIERTRALSSPDQAIVGDPFSYWGLSDYPEFYVTWAEYELIRGLGYTTADELWAAIDPALVVNVYRPGFPEIPAALKRYITEQHYRLVDSFTWQGYPVEFWRRPEPVG